jgi:hypothetical protein
VSDWVPITMSEVRIVTSAAFGEKIIVKGIECEYMVCDGDGNNGIAVKNIDDLRELVPSLRPACITLDCTDAERPVLLALVQAIKQDRRCIEAMQ